MHESLPFRSRCRNFGTAAAAPAALFLIATRARGADAAIVTLRADLSDLPRAGAIRHACQVLDAMAAQYDGETVDVQLLDGAGIPLMFATGEPAGRGAGAVLSGQKCARCGWKLRAASAGVCPVCSPAGGQR